MTEAEYIDMIMRCLQKVLAKQLRLIELANQIPIQHGELDPQILEDLQPEINLAIEEAKNYGSHTLMAVDSLIRIKAIPEGADQCGT